jgi:hypothetical protein
MYIKILTRNIYIKFVEIVREIKNPEEIKAASGLSLFYTYFNSPDGLSACQQAEYRPNRIAVHILQRYNHRVPDQLQIRKY